MSTAVRVARGRGTALLVAVIAVGIAGIGLLLRTSSGLPNDYAVCSTGSQIYTVDEINPRVECIAVSGSRIVHTGTLGPLSFCCRALELSIFLRRSPSPYTTTLGLY